MYNLIIVLVLASYSLCDGLGLADAVKFIGKKTSTFRFLESNSWELTLNDIKVFIDPVMGQLDFGIPSLYAGNKRVIDEGKEINNISQNADLIIISQGFDDHAHTPTLQKLAKLNSNLKYLCPPSAKGILEKCGISSNSISTILPGENFTFKKGNTDLEVVATTGALLGPPWQQKENGYILRSKKAGLFPSVYYEPHCMFDETELTKYSADVVITPIVSQELPAYTLVAGGEKALKLADVLKAKYLIPMANGNLDTTGVLSAIVKTAGSESEFRGLARRLNSRLKVLSAPPGQEVSLPM